MTWRIEFIESAMESLEALDKEQRTQVMKAIRKKLTMAPVQYGDPLGRKLSRNLTGLYSLRCDQRNIRVVYKPFDGVVHVVVVVAVDTRSEFKAHDAAARVMDSSRALFDLAGRAAKIGEGEFAAALEVLLAAANARETKRRPTGT